MNETTGHSRLYFWLRELPYAVVWILTVFGVGYTSVAKQALVAYWEFLAVVIGVRRLRASSGTAQRGTSSR